MAQNRTESYRSHSNNSTFGCTRRNDDAAWHGWIEERVAMISIYEFKARRTTFAPLLFTHIYYLECQQKPTPQQLDEAIDGFNHLRYRYSKLPFTILRDSCEYYFFFCRYADPKRILLCFRFGCTSRIPLTTHMHHRSYIIISSFSCSPFPLSDAKT